MKAKQKVFSPSSKKGGNRPEQMPRFPFLYWRKKRLAILNHNKPREAHKYSSPASAACQYK
jgi:hypothetical protein